MDTKPMYLGCTEQQKKMLDAAEAADSSGDIDSAKKLYLEILELNDEVPYVHAMLGGIEFDSGNYKSAWSYFDKAISLKPNSPGAVELRGECKEHLCMFKAAVQDYDLAITLKPNFAKAYFRKGLIFHYEGDACRNKRYYRIAYKCLKTAVYFDAEEYAGYLSYYKRKLKYLKRIRLV